MAAIAAAATAMPLAGSASAGSGDWIVSRQDNDYHFVEQWSDYLYDGDPATTFQTGPHAVNPTAHQWTFDDEVRHFISGGKLAPGESYTFDETYLSDSIERNNQAAATARHGTLQVTVDVSNPFHSRSSTEIGETCVVGPTYPHIDRNDHSSPYASFIVGSDVTEHELVDDGGWAVDHTTVTVTVTNIGNRTARNVVITSLIGRPYDWLPPTRPAACDGLEVTPESGFEPRWRS